MLFLLHGPLCTASSNDGASVNFAIVDNFAVVAVPLGNNVVIRGIKDLVATAFGWASGSTGEL